jgi:hypothetical protein
MTAMRKYLLISLLCFAIPAFAEAKPTQHDAGPAEDIGVTGSALRFCENFSQRWGPHHHGDQ